jgi:transcriptional regulator GlxA family with amidase domain
MHVITCEMLVDSRQSISQIAWRLGYGDPANFSHAFRATGGASPRQYR